jgi:flavin reductase (DIM6/NTAB) family NADH-FMN oxidoreductase RutF
MEYKSVPDGSAYALLNCGGIVLVCTRSEAGPYDLAPIAWACPLDYEPTSRVLFVCDPAHATHDNLMARREFALALPTPGQRALVLAAGSSSGCGRDKFADLGLSSFLADKVDARIPEGVAGWIECRLIKAQVEGSVSIVMGEVVSARAVDEAWKLRLHYVSESLFYAPGAALEPPSR